MSQDTKKYRDRNEHLRQQQQTGWHAQWKDISEHILPRKGVFSDRNPNQGDTRHGKIIDGTPVRSLRTLAAGMRGGLTTPTKPWFKLSLEDQYWAEHPMVKLWLEEVTKRLRYALARSNFYQSAHAMYAELGGFGTGCVHIQKGGAGRKLHFPQLTIGTYRVALDQFGMVDTIYRDMQLTVKQAVEKFGRDKLSTDVAKMYDTTPYAYIDIVHAVQPNSDRDKGKIDNQNMAFESVYYEDGYDNKLLRKSGYESFPFAVPRWDVTDADAYGRGPGMDVLPDCKMLQAESKTLAKILQRGADPPLKGSPDLRGKVSLYPGAINYTDGTLEEVIKSKPDARAAFEAKLDSREAVKAGLYNDLFLMLTQPSRDVTATEIMERKEEKMWLLGPVVDRHNIEFTDVIIENSLNILMEEPDFPMLPPEIMEQIGEYNIEYVSVLAQAQKMVGTQALQKTMEFAGNLAQAFPSVLDKVDPDAALDEYHDMVGAPVRIIKSTSDESVQATRAGRAQQEQQAQQAQQVAMQQAIQGESLNQQHTAAKSAKVASEALGGAAGVDTAALLENVKQMG